MRNLDKYYTQSSIADNLVGDFYINFKALTGVDIEKIFFIEPSAGKGAFIWSVRNLGLSILGIDLEPASDKIIRADFLCDDKIFDRVPQKDKNKKLVIIGNPPFGFASHTAVKFFNRAAARAFMIAFIVPRTFRKISIQKKLDKNFHLILDKDLPRNSFLKNDKPHDVPCAWQIWKRDVHKRQQVSIPDVSHLITYTIPDAADFAMRRVGGRAGSVLSVCEAKSISSNYYLKELRSGVKEALQQIDWSVIRNSTVGVRSISKDEIAIALNNQSQSK